MVIMVNGVKSACSSCIRGHRVKSCDHNDRPLIPIAKRGRQVTQCNHCRDLRKTNNSHVKCTCAVSGAPNPINGCLCEVILSCNCVAGHLQEVNDDDSATGSPSTVVSQPTPELHPATLSLPWVQTENITGSPTIDAGKMTQEDLDNYLVQLHNDLDKYLSSV